MVDSDTQLILVPHIYQGALIEQRAGDGYINATSMCQAAGRLWGHYRENATTKKFLEALSVDIGIPISTLVQSVKGGNADMQGTYVHPQIALHLAQWLSPEFAVKVTEWLYEWMSGKHPSDRVWQQFEDRVSLVYDNVPLGYFCVFRQIADLFASMIANGADFGTRMILDISVGSCWAAHWKAEKLHEKFGEHAKFPHYYPGYFAQSLSNPQPANCFPEDAIPTFNRWLRDVYVPHKMPAYLKKLVADKKLPPQIANNTLAALAARAAGRAKPLPSA
jgi:hypothetical protein